MPVPPSLPSLKKANSYLESYPSSGLLNGYALSPSSSNVSISSSGLPTSPNMSISSAGLPPAVPYSQHTRRFTPIRKIPYMAGLDVPSDRKPVMFHSRPLRSLTVVSDSPDRSRSCTRSPSPTPSNYSIRSNSSLRSIRSSSCCPPRRVLPQCYERSDFDMSAKEESPVVFDANLTFVLGCKGKLRQNVTPIPAHEDAATASNALTNKINDFLQRTDHVMDEWKLLGGKEDEQHSLRMKKSSGKILGRSRSATNIMIKGFQYFSRASSCSRSSMARDLETNEDAATVADVDELSEMTADLAEEHSTATLAAERLDAETSERLKLEKELADVQSKNRELQQASERLEMELLTVYLGQRLHSEQKVVIKQIVVFKGKELLNAQNEVNILKSLNHPNIIKYLDVYAKDDNFYLVMEYASKGTLQEKISVERPNYFTAQSVMNTFSQILMGLNHIHRKRIIHRDLKCENIFLTGIDGDVVKIGDFGISKQMLQDDKALTSIGTYNYVAPELCDGKPYDFKTDIWALGCILYELCSMEKMFDGTVKEIVLSIVSGKRKVVNMDVYGKQIQKMINWMLQLNPENRPDTIALMALPDVYPSMYRISEEDEEGDGESGGVYKQRYERAVKELEFTRRRLQQQHEDDLEQLVGLKKQLEKKVEEQRQVVGQWKRKVQKLNGEMNDLRLLLEEQNGRNNLLEKKQRKFDSETQMLQDELKKERQAKERLAREKEDTRLELELKEEKLLALQREFDEVTCGGKTEEEVTVLRRQKIDLERRMQDQEEELDELAGQVQLLEQAKLRLEMTLEQMRKEAKKEAHARDEELEDVRCNAQKKVKALEQQLENEHEERTLLLREKHELERRLAAAAESERQDRAGDEALLHRLKKDVKRTKALLRDTQAQLERQKAETPGKAMIRQLRNQVEDLECARATAVKAKQSLETELLETQSQLEEANKLKQEAEERVNLLQREKADLQTQLEENEEELAEVLKKFKGTVQQMSLDQMALQEQVSLVSELEIERNHLKEQLAELTSKLESAESMGDASSNLLVKRSELKVKELESKLELEQTTRSRLEVQITRLKEAVDKAQNDTAQSRVKEQQAQDQIRKLQRQLREIKEELNKSLAKESEVILKKKELEKRCEVLEAESATARTDLRLALKRIEDLQSAIQGDLEDTISDNSDSDPDTYSSDESVNTFMTNHKLSSPKSDKNPILSDSRRTSGTTSRSSTSSNLAKDASYT
nr:unnamed protein product [Callosobruchus chinensis]